MPRNSLLLRLLGLLAACCLVTPAAIGQINACKYLQVTDFTSDPYAIAQELRSQARKQGFTVVSSLSEIAKDELFKACIMHASWSAQLTSGQLSVRVADAFSGELIAEASTVGTNWWGIGRTVRKGVEKIYSQLGYKGFSESVYQSRMQRLYPPRPTLPVTEEQIRKSQPKTLLEGIWSDPTDKYRMAIVPASQGSSADYFGVVLRSDSPVWQAGEIKAEFRSTATPDVFTCTYFMGNKKPLGATFILEHDVILRSVVNTLTGQADLVFLRVWPKSQTETAKVEPGQVVSSGTGFFLNNSGLFATNWHVVNGATHITFTLPGWSEAVKADLLVKDVVNDLALIKATNLKKLKDACPAVPYQLASANSVALGQRVSTIGYPLSSFLGSSPKFSEGAVSSKSGLQDDPRHLQISVPIQPGNSGGPLFDAEGNIIGIVDSSLNAGGLYESRGIIAQNVNYAIKSDYLVSLMSMLSNETLGVKTGTFSADNASHCVAFIRAW